MQIGKHMSRVIDNSMMRDRLANKKIENQFKPVLASEDAVQTADYTFSPITPLDRIGDSGQLLLAKNKKDRILRYLVKHEYTDCACNEFVYTKIAQAMGYRMPDAVLFQISNGEKLSYFKTEYIIGERYLDLLIEHPSFADIREQAINWQDYFGLRALYAMTNEADSFETPLAVDGFIYRVDTTDAFPISSRQLEYLGINLEFEGVNIHESLKSQLASNNFDGILSTSYCDGLLMDCIRKYADCLDFYLEPFRRIQDLHSDYIDDFLNTLCYFYPDCLGDYFKRYISALQKQAFDYLKMKR